MSALEKSDVRAWLAANTGRAFGLGCYAGIDAPRLLRWALEDREDELSDAEFMRLVTGIVSMRRVTARVEASIPPRENVCHREVIVAEPGGAGPGLYFRMGGSGPFRAVVASTPEAGGERSVGFDYRLVPR